MATIKKSAKSAPKMTKPVAAAKRGAPKPKMTPMPPIQAPQGPSQGPTQAPPMGGGQPMMKKGGSVSKELKGKKGVKAGIKMGKKKASVSISKK